MNFGVARRQESTMAHSYACPSQATFFAERLHQRVHEGALAIAYQVRKSSEDGQHSSPLEAVAGEVFRSRWVRLGDGVLTVRELGNGTGKLGALLESIPLTSVKNMKMAEVSDGQDPTDFQLRIGDSRSLLTHHTTIRDMSRSDARDMPGSPAVDVEEVAADSPTYGRVRQAAVTQTPTSSGRPGIRTLHVRARDKDDRNAWFFAFHRAALAFAIARAESIKVISSAANVAGIGRGFPTRVSPGFPSVIGSLALPGHDMRPALVSRFLGGLGALPDTDATSVSSTERGGGTDAEDGEDSPGAPSLSPLARNSSMPASVPGKGTAVAFGGAINGTGYMAGVYREPKRSSSSTSSSSDDDEESDGAQATRHGRSASHSDVDDSFFGFNAAVMSPQAAQELSGARAHGRSSMKDKALAGRPMAVPPVPEISAACSQPGIPTGRYIPPHLRANAQLAPTPLAVDVDSDRSLCSGEGRAVIAPAVLLARCIPPGLSSSSVWEGTGDTRYGVWSAQGHRPSMEDSHIAVRDLRPDCACPPAAASPLAPLTEYFAIFDGHCGPYTAKLAAQLLHRHLLEHVSYHTLPHADEEATVGLNDATKFRPMQSGPELSGIALALRSSFLAIDSELDRRVSAGEAIGKDAESGSTALAVVMRGHDLIVGFVGDCRAVLGTQARTSTRDAPVYTPRELSRDHTPSEEKTRIHAAGGWVSVEKEMNLARVHDMDSAILGDPWVKERLGKLALRTVSRLNGDLGVSRALGDLSFKAPRMDSSEWCWPRDHTAREFTADLVLAEPEVVHVTLASSDRGRSFLLLACDGLWEVLSSAEAVELAGRFIWERQVIRASSGQAALLDSPYTQQGDPLGEEGDAMVAARRLVDMALRLGSTDNITAMLIRM